MTAQEAAHTLLNEIGRPMTSRELAKMALDRHMVVSNSKDPVFSLASTVEKNIRDGVYNHPALTFISSPAGRLVGLPGWEKVPPMHSPSLTPRTKEFTARIPEDLLDQIQLAVQAKLAESFDGTVAHLLRSGLAMAAPTIKDGLMKQLHKLAV